MQNLQQKQLATLFELKVVCYNKKDGEARIDDEDSDGDDPDVELSGTESLDEQSTSSELLSKDASAQSKYRSPIQPVFENYPRTTFGTGKNSRNRNFCYYWYSKFPFIEYCFKRCSILLCCLFPHPTAFTEPVFTSVGYRGWKAIRKSLEKQ